MTKVLFLGQKYNRDLAHCRFSNVGNRNAYKISAEKYLGMCSLEIVTGRWVPKY